VDDQLGVTWGNHPTLHSDDRSNLLLQPDAPWSWDRWSAFWFWVEQPHLSDPWGTGNFNFSGTFVHPDNPEDRTDFDLTRSASENQGHLDTLVVLDGIVRPYDCIATTEQGSNCYGSNERIQGLFSEPPLLDGAVNPNNHWADYVYHAVGHFSQFGIEYYQAYNEPNLGGENPGPDPGVWNNGPDPDEDEWADDYAQLVTVTLAAAQAVDSQAKIVLAASVSNLDQYQGGTWLDRAFQGIEEQGLYYDVEALALHSYLRPDLLVLDDFGLKSLHPPAPEDLYDVINERYERGSILLTSNRALEEWPDLFGAPLLASAGLDRLTHNARVVIVTGASFRAHVSERAGKEEPIESTAN